jgi:hypothetical protein
MNKQEITAIVTATFPAGLPANQKVAASMQLDPQLGTVTQQQVPINESWVIDDVYVSESQTPDAILEFKKNLYTSLVRTNPINTLLVSNPSRPKVAKKVLGKGDILTIEAQNLAEIGTEDATITVYVTLVRFMS